MEEEETPEVKALRNNIVIVNIAQYLDPTNLAILRATCKLWNKCMIPTLAKTNTVPVKLTQDNVNDFLLTICSKINQCHQHLPYTRYKCKDISFNPDLYTPLFTNIGSSLTHLKLVTSCTSNAVQLTLNQFRHIIFNLAPQLVELEIRDKRKSVVGTGGNKKVGFWNQGPIFDDDFPFKTLPSLDEIEFKLVDAYGVECEQFMTDFFNSAINLIVINYEHRGSLAINNLALLRGMSMTPETKDFSKLSCLTLDWVSNPEIELLIQLTHAKNLHLVRLTIFDIESTEGEMECHNLSILLNLQSETLVDFYLGLDDELFQYQQYLKLHSMRVLEELILDTRKYGIINQYTTETLATFVVVPTQFDNETFFSFSSLFPELKRFEYRYTVAAYPFDDVDQLFMPLEVLKFPFTPHPGVTTLKVETVCNNTQLNNLSLLFPGITKLSLMLLPETLLNLLPLIWVKWLGLTKLKLSYLAPKQNNSSSSSNETEDNENTKLLDTAITGVPSASHETLVNLLLKNSLADSSSNMNNLMMYKTGPGLSDLKYLKKLELDLPWSISDVSYLVLWSNPLLTFASFVKEDKVSAIARDWPKDNQVS